MEPIKPEVEPQAEIDKETTPEVDPVEQQKKINKLTDIRTDKFGNPVRMPTTDVTFSLRGVKFNVKKSQECYFNAEAVLNDEDRIKGFRMPCDGTRFKLADVTFIVKHSRGDRFRAYLAY